MFQRTQDKAEGNVIASVSGDDILGEAVSADNPAITSAETTSENLYSGIRFQGTADSLQRVYLYPLDESRNIFAAFLPSGMETSSIVFDRFASLSLNGISYNSGDSLPRLTKEDERPHTDDELLDPDADPSKVHNIHKVQSYTGLDISYKTSDGILIDADLTRFDGSNEKGLIYFFYGENVPTLFVDTADKSIQDLNDGMVSYKDIRMLSIDEEGKEDSYAKGIIRIRGNGSATADVKPYSINLDSSMSVLDLSSCSKFALLNTFRGNVQHLYDKAAFTLAKELGMKYVPDSTFVNLYINGQYNGFYLLCQRVNADGGSVKIHNLRADNKKLNRKYYKSTKKEQEEENTEKPSNSVSDTMMQNQESAEDNQEDFKDTALPNSPANISGGYLLEFDGYKGGTSYFNSGSEWVSIRAPKETTKDEFDYISSYMKMLDRALHADDGVDPVTGEAYSDYLDLDSWAKIYVIEEYFAQYDVNFSSFYMYKDINDDHLYAGPIWDFELSGGHTSFENHPEIMKRTLLIHNGSDSWLRCLEKNPDFIARVQDIYQQSFVPLVQSFLDNDFDSIYSSMIPSLSMNAVRWNYAFPDAEEEFSLCKEWLRERTAYLTDLIEEPEKFCRITFHFGWGSLSAYVEKNKPIGFVPSAQYHETDDVSLTATDDFGYLDHFEDAEGNQLTENSTFDHDTELYAIFRNTFPDIWSSYDSFQSLKYVLNIVPDLKCNSILIVGANQWQREYESTILCSRLASAGIQMETLETGTVIVVIEDGQIAAITNADQFGATAAINENQYTVYFGEDQFGIYRNGEEIVVDSLDHYPPGTNAYLYMFANGDWGDRRYAEAINSP